jgi:cation diffusion facilitator family transporter
VSSGSKRVVYAGFIANIVILVAKITAAALTGSTAMLAEALHSTVDTGNSLLLLLGHRASRKPADDLHPFGHGKALYFWTFVVAVSTFSAGGVMSIFEGVRHLLHPEPISSPQWAYVVLGTSAGISLVSLLIGLKEVSRRRRKESLLQYVQRSKDPSISTVVFEDMADIAGELTAMLAILLTTRFGIAWADGAGSIVIGAGLILVSGVLANESRGLLIGESADTELIESIRRLLSADPAVDRLGPLLTMQLGPEQVLLNLEVEFYPSGSIEALEQTIDRITRKIQDAHPTVKQVYLEANSLDPKLRQKKAS